MIINFGRTIFSCSNPVDTWEHHSELRSPGSELAGRHDLVVALTPASNLADYHGTCITLPSGLVLCIAQWN